MDQKEKNNYVYNYSKDSQTLFYEKNSETNLRTLFQLICQFIKIDNVSGFIVNEKNQIMKFNDIDHTLFNDDFFNYYENNIQNSTQPMEKLQEYFHQKNSCFVCALTDQNLCLGYLIYTRKKDHGDWSDIEKNKLFECTQIYSEFLLDVNSYKDSYFRQTIFHKMINNIDSYVYVTNPSTDEILFMNDKMKQAYQMDEPVGQICWKVLQRGIDQRCDNCPIEFLNQNTQESYTWEEKSSFNQKFYRNYDCMIEWFDHSIVHFQHSVDITDLKKASFEASYDELTGIYNRRFGKNELEDRLLEAKQNQKNVIVALYDLDNLKLTNDVYGHIQGDYMLKCIAEEVEKNLCDHDIFFRLSGDEFVVGMYDCTTSQASQRMQEILHSLRIRADNEKLKYQLSFCYGLYKVTPDNFLSINDIIMKTDERMYEWKKKNHLKQAYENMKKDNFHKKEKFDYNQSLLYDALLKSTDDYIFICNMKTGIFRYTPAMVEEFDFPNEVLHNAAAVFGSKIHKDDKYEFLNSNQKITDGKTDSHIVEYRALNKNNEWVWLRCRGHVEYNEEHEPAIFAGFISNLGKKNYRDILTGLYNKFEFEKRISETQAEFSIMLLNIDDFKALNNLYNREFGDNVLRIIGQNLQTILSKEATVFKLDGDEFGLFIKKSDNPDILKLIFDKIQEFVNQQHICDNSPFTFSITAGAVLAPQNGTTYLELLKNCEMTLQYGKYNYRGKLSTFNEKIFKEKTYQTQLIHVLKQDIVHHYRNFSLVFQPIINTSSNQICTVESLCRWQHSNFENISPGIFIPLLEETGDIVRLGKWIFEQSIMHLKTFLETDPSLSMSINISYIQFIEEDFATFIEKTIRQCDVPFQNIILELTETAIAKNAHQTIETIQQLRTLGIRIAMDDFGTGYSSLSLLKNEPLDIIKIDQSFVRGLHNDSFNQAFIKSIIELCHQIHLSVLIEGVETKEELEILLPLQSDFIQGYYTGMPMKHDELLHLIKKSIDIFSHII